MKYIFILGRSACGKTEFIGLLEHKLKNCIVVDDFRFLKELAEHEDALETLSYPRILTERVGPGILGKNERLFDYINIRLNNHLKECQNEQPVIIEFARGAGKLGYLPVFECLDREILSNSVIVYLKVSFEEVLKRNRTRKRKIPEEAMIKFFKNDDLEEKEGCKELVVKGVSVPFLFIDNEKKMEGVQKLREHFLNSLELITKLI